MWPQAKGAAGGPSVLSEDIISETVEQIELFLGRLLGNQPGLARGFLGKARARGSGTQICKGRNPCDRNLSRRRWTRRAFDDEVWAMSAPLTEKRYM